MGFAARETALCRGHHHLAKLPLGRFRPHGFYSSWPSYAREWDEMMVRCATELERMAEEGKLNLEFAVAYHDWTDNQNRTYERPTAAEISVMECALAWPGSYLRDRRDLTHALNVCALAQSRGLSVRDVVKHEAAHQIAVGLRINKIVVF
jgi:hypothetical protein